MADVGILDQVTLQFLHAIQQKAHFLEQAALHLFYGLALLQLTGSMLWSVLSGESVERLFIRVIQQFLMLGVFYSLIQCAGDWIPQLLNGFLELGQGSANQNVQSISPSSIIDQGLAIASGIIRSIHGTGLINAIFVAVVAGISGCAITVIYGLLAAELTILLVKSYVLTVLASIFFAFAGMDYTRSMAINYIKTTIGLGLQLMTTYFILGIGIEMCHSFEFIFQPTEEPLLPVLTILTACIVLYMLVKNIPVFVANLSGVGGFRHYGEAAVGTSISSAYIAWRMANKLAPKFK